ncbi:MAG: hypothetical protein LUE22_06475 [Oscillospiraceae bacterium]|nr:hypothetical protein [Oscillospiraceae bacterium]
MVDEREIDIEIARLEYAESSYPNYAKLANLYTIKNQLHKGEREVIPSYSLAPAPDDTVGEYGDSAFLRSVVGKDSASAWAVMDDLMDTLSVVNARVYNRVLDKIRAI